MCVCVCECVAIDAAENTPEVFPEVYPERTPVFLWAVSRDRNDIPIACERERVRKGESL